MADSDFKICPYCRERIRASAIKCRYCGEWLEKPVQPRVARETEPFVELDKSETNNQHTEQQKQAATVLPVPEDTAMADQVIPPSHIADTETPQSDPSAREEQSARTPGNYFVRHWRGDLSVGISYWVNCVLFCVAYVAGFSVVAQIGVAINPWTAVPVIATMCLFFIVATVWQVVGTWRSSAKHVGRGGSAAMAVLAKVVMVLWAGAAVKSLATDWVSLGTGLRKAIAFQKTIPECKIQPIPGGKDIDIRGGLPFGSADKLEAALKGMPQTTVVHVNSPGGLIHEAQKMASVVRQRGLSTYTDGCASAATLVFMAGKERTMSDGAKIGFHAPSSYGMWAEEKEFGDSLVRETMRSARISEDFINRVLATPNGELWYPSVDEMRRAGVITREDAPLKTFASSILSLIENPTNSGSFVPEKTGHDDIDQLTRVVMGVFARWAQLFTEMTSDLEKAGEPEVYSDQLLKEQANLHDAVAIQLKRQEIIENYRSKAHQEIERMNRDLAATNPSDPSAKGMLKGMTNSIEKSRLQAEELFTLRLKVEIDKKRFLEFMSRKFSSYKLDAGKIRFENQDDSDNYKVLTRAITDSTKAFEDFKSRMLQSIEAGKVQLKKATQ